MFWYKHIRLYLQKVFHQYIHMCYEMFKLIFPHIDICNTNSELRDTTEIHDTIEEQSDRRTPDTQNVQRFISVEYYGLAYLYDNQTW